MQLMLKNNMNTTTVPNGFIKSCAGAPEKYISAYLFALMHAQQSQRVDFSMLCARLLIREDELMDALEYWQKKGYVKIHNKQDFCIEFGVFANQESEEDIYTEREYNIELQKIFGSRQLSPHELIKIYDYTDVFRLPKKVVLILAEYCVMLRGKRVSISYMDKVAQAWAEEEHINTEEKAREKIDAYKTSVSGLLRVLTQLGISSRRPTKDESTLFEKWTREWGFSLDAILTACAKTTASREPSMKYLDRILERLHTEGETTSRKITESAATSDDMSKSISALLHILGHTSTKATFEDERLYMKWTSVYGYGMDMLEFAAQHASAQGRMPLSYVDGILTVWYNNKIFTTEEAKESVSMSKMMDGRITEAFKAAGIAKLRILDAHRKAYLKWTQQWHMSEDAILLAAEISSTRDYPYQYLDKLLSNWHESGVKSLPDAQREWQASYNKPSVHSGRMTNERPTDNYDHLAVDLFADEGA